MGQNPACGRTACCPTVAWLLQKDKQAVAWRVRKDGISKMKKSVCSIFLIILFQNLLYSQDTAIIKYFPLKTGNKWVYDREQYYSPGPGKDISKVESTFVSNNHRYYAIKNTMYLSNGTIYFASTSTLRVDSLSGNIYSWSSSNECLVDSLQSRFGDTAFSCIAWGPSEWFRCHDTNNYSIFGQNPKSKYFIMLNGFESGVSRRYARNFGIVFKHQGALNDNQFYYLKGCVLDGILYGDTTLSVIVPISAEIPIGFYLSQNYPNPFNPSTKIKFSIPTVGQRHAFDVQVIVYDVLGREIATLVNEQLQPGTYEVEWDGSNYPSGVYFYKLITNDYSETRKMALIK